MIINNSCQLSPLIFIINVFMGIYCNYFLYSLLFLFLIITSIIHHTYYTEFTNIIDKVSILYVILYGTLLFYQKIYCIDININMSNMINLIYIFMIIITFISVFYLYHYGYYNKQYCFDDDIIIAYQYHSMIHYITFFSHSLIMFL
jgi:hypothetical protein